MDSLEMNDSSQELIDSNEHFVENLKYPSKDKLNSENYSNEIAISNILFSNKETLIENFEKSVTNEVVESEDNAVKNENRKRKPAWIDPDDIYMKTNEVKRETKYSIKNNYFKNSSYKELLEKKFYQIVEQPKWAKLDKKCSQNSDDELLQTVGFISQKNIVGLQPTYIQWKKLKDLNRATCAEGRITSIQFHPTSTASLVAGESGIATIYSIDGRKNENLHSIQFKKFPIKCAKIFPCGTKAIFGSTFHFYYSYDLLTGQETKYPLRREIGDFRNFQISPCGKYIGVAGQAGVLHLFDALTHEKINSFKQDKHVCGLRFTSDSSRIICNSISNNLSLFCLRSLKMEHSFLDYGCIKGACLDLSPNQRLLATGTCEGVVNVYDFEKTMLSKNPLPEKSFLNLKTRISDVKFNHSSELLAMSSNLVPNAIKLAHFPSSTVYTNFPNNTDSFNEVNIMEFSPHSGYIALSNQKKQASLIRLKYFENY